MVTEPKQVNSGTPQGAFLKRQVVLKPDGCPFMPDDFSIGCDTGIFGRQVRIYDADDYTRQFYEVSSSQSLSAQEFGQINKSVTIHNPCQCSYSDSG